jgi:ribonuclease HII
VTSLRSFFVSIDPKEKQRLQQMTLLENGFREQGYQIIAGCDEAGRGPLAGPVVAAACILPKSYLLTGLNDSKLIPEKVRKDLYYTITQDSNVIYAISSVPPKVIDEINILQASLLAMKQAVQKLTTKADLLLVDGNQLPSLDMPMEKIIKGDMRCLSIAAASILAKYARDQIMEEAHLCFPMYGFKDHKGYATERHIAALNQHGPCPLHRNSFKPVSIADNLAKLSSAGD